MKNGKENATEVMKESKRNQIINTKLLDTQIGLFYLGQEGFLIKYREQYYLIDAYLSDYVDRNCTTPEVNWVRKYPAPIRAEELDFVDYVFCTHEHFDHADPDTLRKLAQCNSKAKYIMPAPKAKLLEAYGIKKTDILPAKAGEELMLGAARVMPIPAAHEQLNSDAEGNYQEVGYRFLFGDCRLYHAGDCCIYEGLEQKLGTIDIALLPVNGRDYYRLKKDIIGNMTAEEALELAQNLHTKLLVPMHFDLYDCNCISPAAFVDAHTRLHSTVPYHIFQPGELYVAIL